MGTEYIFHPSIHPFTGRRFIPSYKTTISFEGGGFGYWLWCVCGVSSGLVSSFLVVRGIVEGVDLVLHDEVSVGVRERGSAWAWSWGEGKGRVRKEGRKEERALLVFPSRDRWTFNADRSGYVEKGGHGNWSGVERTVGMLLQANMEVFEDLSSNGSVMWMEALLRGSSMDGH